MDPQKITELANLLRNNGDKVLSSEFKLTLTGSLLRALNDSFTLISDSTELVSNQTFQVVKPNYSKSNVFRDLQLIHDFVQKTLYLCIIHYPGDDYFDGVIDISKFQSLKRLEVQKTNVKQIIGVQPLRSQLHQLVCVRSLQSVVEIITHCGGDNSNGFVWNELKNADFSYNNLQTVDSSLEFAQYLQHLNLRHNQLVSVEAIKWLPNLKTLDLSYNRLITVPNFHVETSKRLQSLNLSNNFIEDLIGISKLDLLTDLDLSDNCLLDHNSLFPLCTLMTLKYLNLYGNPLYCHPNHRLATAQFLHKDTCTVKFILDFEPLSKSERALTGTHQHTSHSTYASKYMVKSTSRLAASKQLSSSQTPTSSVGSTNSFQQVNIAEDEEVDKTASEKSKRVKVRQVIIECSDQILNKEDAIVTPKEENTKNNKDHLETKKQFKFLRNKYGAGWLQNENAQIMHNMLGLCSSNAPIEIDSETTQQVFYNYLGEVNANHMNDTEDTSLEILIASDDTTSVTADSKASESTTANQENKLTFQSTSRDEEKEEPLDIAPHLENIYIDTVYEEEISDPETDEENYIVHTLETNQAVILTISSNYIREKHISNHKTKAKWSLKILESCDRMKSSMLRINFDTIKIDKKERVYMIEEVECQKLEKKLRAILSKRDLFEMNQKVYRCINCSCQFSVENTLNNHRKPDIYCPDCKSTFVTEVHNLPASLEKISKSIPELSVAEVKDVVEDEKPLELPLHTDTGEWIREPENRMNGSIGSTNSLNETSSCSKISNSQDSFDSNQSVAGSSTKDRENCLKSNGESDVDIISNPSQSSIEVLDHVYASRKNSEDRKVCQSSNLETINDCLGFSDDQEDIIPQNNAEIKHSEYLKQKTLSGQLHLTESSSSGSVTDSVCTTYDQGNITPIKGYLDEEKNCMKTQILTKETSKREDSKLSTMFGGLLQSTNMLMSRSTGQANDSNPSAKPSEKYSFNYTDFSDVDHRIKFYFYQMKFEEQSEHFKWIVRGKIYNQNSRTITNAIVVMSTVKCYIMEEFGPENDNISKWLRPIVSVTADRLESIQLLPWKVGLCFTLRDWGGFLLLLQDILRTDSLLFYFTRNVLPDQCELNYHVSQTLLHRLTQSVEGEQIKMFSLLNSCELKSREKVQRLDMSGLLITDTRLFITTSNLSWLTTSETGIEIGFSQIMSNLIEVEHAEENIFIIHFHDETQDKSEFWKCTFETKENAKSCLNTIGQSWEKLFGVPLFSN